MFTLLLHLSGPLQVAPLVSDLALVGFAAVAERSLYVSCIGIGVGLLAYLCSPPSWATVGEYAAFVPILVAGLEGRRVLRSCLSVVYLTIFALIADRHHPGGRWVNVVALWLFFLVLTCVATGAFNQYRAAQQLRMRAVLGEQRAFLARELHDTIAHELTRITMRTQQIQLHGSIDPGDLDEILEHSDQALVELRSVMDILRESDRTPTVSTGPVQPCLDRASASLTSAGFVVHCEAEPCTLRIEVLATVGRLLDECVHNILQHGDPRQPVAIRLRRSVGEVELTVENHVGWTAAVPGHTPRGLQGMRERVEVLGGSLAAGLTHPESGTWRVVARIPIQSPAGVAPHSPRRRSRVG